MPQTSAEVREQLIRALRLDLVGPAANNGADAEYERERLPMSPSRWYLTGFLAPSGAPDDQRSDEAVQEELDLAGDSDIDGDEDQTPEKTAAKRAPFPSSLGLSVLVPANVTELDAVVSWGDYAPEQSPESEGSSEHADEVTPAAPPTRDQVWTRIPQQRRLRVPIPEAGAKATPLDIPDSHGLKLYASARDIGDGMGLPQGTRAVAVFLVNEREAAPSQDKDRAFVFQATMELGGTQFVPRPDPRRGTGDDWDDRVADLQYANVYEYATGHGISAHWELRDGSCSRVRTTWTPCANVQLVEPARMPSVMLGMEALASSPLDEIKRGLEPLLTNYASWIAQQRAGRPSDASRRGTADELLSRAELARTRIEAGIAFLTDPLVLRAFQIANDVMAQAARRRAALQTGRKPLDVEPPAWYPFQLAFILLNVCGISEPEHGDREVVDLLFFPTGGGKTEAYLGLAAFTLALRRLREPTIASAGMTVLMRYTLRLLTLDQLGRAAAMICALELTRQRDPDALGPWPFEIGLWVGRTATPNRMGERGHQDEHSARKRVQAFQRDSKHKPSPIPIEICPWCGAKFTKDSFRLEPDANRPIDLRVACVSATCEFSGERSLPIVAVDEPLYRRLPCFIIATVDKFASLPFEARAGALFGIVDRYDANGFYGAADPGRGNPLPTNDRRLPPPELIIQDELHLISGPLGTIAGLYEAAIDKLATAEASGHRIRPKIVASTATVRRAEKQIVALFARRRVELFPPASIDRSDSFFARTSAPDERAPREYLGIAAPGRSIKVTMLRTYVALLAASQKAFMDAGGDGATVNPADPYLTVLGYFNALRELGGARRIVEDEVNSRVKAYGDRKRVGETSGLFADREIEYEVLELTSRVSTSDVARAKRRLERPWRIATKGERVDVALATNMISVGLDITRLGLMVVLGQPRGSAEYIQSTSRVGRDADRPGLVVTLLTTNKPRDRSHYERFGFYHSTFYRSVEATSVTPFAPRAVDRVLPALVVSLARHMVPELTPAQGAIEIASVRAQLQFVMDTLATRVDEHDLSMDPSTRVELRQKLQALARELLDDWSRIAHEQSDTAAKLKYQQYEKVERAYALLRDPLEPQLATLDHPRPRFKAARSMRDVEPQVLLLKRGSHDGT